MRIVLLQKNYLFGKIKSLCEMLNPFGNESKTKLMKLRQPHLVFIRKIFSKLMYHVSIFWQMSLKIYLRIDDHCQWNYSYKMKIPEWERWKCVNDFHTSHQRVIIYIVSLYTCAYSNGLRFEGWLTWHLTHIWMTCLNWNPTMCE